MLRYPLNETPFFETFEDFEDYFQKWEEQGTDLHCEFEDRAPLHNTFWAWNLFLEGKAKTMGSEYIPEVHHKLLSCLEETMALQRLDLFHEIQKTAKTMSGDLFVFLTESRSAWKDKTRPG
jgi:hypothetical protein